MKAFIGVNYFMPLNPLPNIRLYWDGNHFIGNVGIENIFTRSRFQEILQNLHFSDNSKQDGGGFDVQVPLAICSNLICTLDRSKMLKSIKVKVLCNYQRS